MPWLILPGPAGTRPDLPLFAPEAAPPPPELAAELALCQVVETQRPGSRSRRSTVLWVVSYPPAEVGRLVLAVAALTERQVAELAGREYATPEWDAAAGSWRVAMAAGIPRQLDWYRSRHVLEDWPAYGHSVSYPLGYLAAAVACRDLLTAGQYAALTGWAAGIVPVPPHPDRTRPHRTRTRPAPDRTAATP